MKRIKVIQTNVANFERYVNGVLKELEGNACIIQDMQFNLELDMPLCVITYIKEV